MIVQFMSRWFWHSQDDAAPIGEDMAPNAGLLAERNALGHGGQLQERSPSESAGDGPFKTRVRRPLPHADIRRPV